MKLGLVLFNLGARVWCGCVLEWVRVFALLGLVCSFLVLVLFASGVWFLWVLNLFLETVLLKQLIAFVGWCW